MTKSNPGNFFEDFTPGQQIAHATPRTLTEADAALNIALTGSRHALFSGDSFAQDCGLPGAPIDPLLVFHTVFGKTVPDISLNAVANLGYAEGRFLVPVYPGDTLSAVSEVMGLKANSNGKTGVVTVRTTGFNQDEEAVLT
jgi:2-methylfumaryl-CoA hydratase